MPALAFEDNASVPYYADALEAGNLTNSRPVIFYAQLKFAVSGYFARVAHGAVRLGVIRSSHASWDERCVWDERYIFHVHVIGRCRNAAYVLTVRFC